jgi:hypothetical protein
MDGAQGSATTTTAQSVITAWVPTVPSCAGLDWDEAPAMSDQIAIEVQRTADQIEREIGHLDRERRIVLERELFALVQQTKQRDNEGGFW